MQLQEYMMNDLFTELSEQEQEVVAGGLDYTAFFNNLATQYGVTGPTGSGGPTNGSGSFNFSSLASSFGGSSNTSSNSSFNFSSLANLFGGSSSSSSFAAGPQAGPAGFF